MQGKILRDFVRKMTEVHGSPCMEFWWNAQYFSHITVMWSSHDSNKVIYLVSEILMKHSFSASATRFGEKNEIEARQKTETEGITRLGVVTLKLCSTVHWNIWKKFYSRLYIQTGPASLPPVEPSFLPGSCAAFLSLYSQLCRHLYFDLEDGCVQSSVQGQQSSSHQSDHWDFPVLRSTIELHRDTCPPL